MSYLYERLTYGNLKVRGLVVIDIGAGFGVGADSVGYFLSQGAAEVYAFEADPKRKEALRLAYGNNARTVLMGAWTGQQIPGDVLKVDCEGCEIQLTPDILGRYTQWSVGLHPTKISQAEYVRLRLMLLTYSGGKLRITEGREEVYSNA